MVTLCALLYPYIIHAGKTMPSSRTERLEEQEELDALISRDRDINEIVAATVSESVRGASKSSTR